jgi:hypothetical protein
MTGRHRKDVRRANNALGALSNKRFMQALKLPEGVKVNVTLETV